MLKNNINKKNTNKKNQRKKNEKGSAVLEAIPALFLMVLVFNFAFGFWGITHSAILNNIGAYNYAFETFRFRSNLIYLRPGNADFKTKYDQVNNRVHGVIAAGTSSNEQWMAQVLPITFTAELPYNDAQITQKAASHQWRDRNQGVWRVTASYIPDDQVIQIPTVMQKQLYGICLRASCRGKR